MARILVVDDDQDILRVVERVLKMSNHDVFVANDAMKAMDLLNAATFDLLISDANMPRFSGFELVRTIKNNKRFHRMAIAMLTGLREKKDLEKAIRAGVDDYIVKPIDPVVLVQKVEQLFAKKPPVELLMYEFPERTAMAQSRVSLQTKVKVISETGMIFKSQVEIPEGMMVQVDADIFHKMDVKIPSMKVISCKKLVEFDYEIRVAFLGINEGFQHKVRSWILSQYKKVRVAAS